MRNNSTMTNVHRWKKESPVINAVTPESNSETVTDQLWNNLDLENKKIPEQVPELKASLYAMLHEYQNWFVAGIKTTTTKNKTISHPPPRKT